MMYFVIIGSPDDVHVRQFQTALHHQSRPTAYFINWQDILRGTIHLADYIPENTCVRIESPGKDALTNQLLLETGYSLPDSDGDYMRISEINTGDKGRIIAPRQWYLGLCEGLHRIREQLSDCPPHHLMNDTTDIALMFDKIACHDYLKTNGIAVAPALPRIQSMDMLENVMRDTGTQRVFVKLAHGSSASGVVALETNGTHYKATAAIEMVTENGDLRLYNTRRIQVYRDYSTIRQLINALCAHRVHVEAWIPKAQMRGQSFDLRMVVIDGKAAHVMARLSRHPMTNLHLLNERQPRESVINYLGEATFQRVITICEATMRLFPRSLYAGLDVLLSRGKRQPYLIEVNAFGDLLKNALYQRMDTYTMEIQRMVARYEHA